MNPSHAVASNRITPAVIRSCWWLWLSIAKETALKPKGGGGVANDFIVFICVGVSWNCLSLSKDQSWTTPLSLPTHPLLSLYFGNGYDYFLNYLATLSLYFSWVSMDDSAPKWDEVFIQSRIAMVEYFSSFRKRDSRLLVFLAIGLLFAGIGRWQIGETWTS